MPIGDFTVLDQIDFKASISAEVEVFAHDSSVSVSVEDFKNELYFSGHYFKIRSLLRVRVALAESPDLYLIAESFLEDIEPEKGRYPVYSGAFEIVENTIKSESLRESFEATALSAFEATRVYHHARFFSDQ